MTNTISILGSNYSIDVHDANSITLGGNLGVVKISTREIVISEQHPDSFGATLLHEILHAIDVDTAADDMLTGSQNTRLSRLLWTVLNEQPPAVLAMIFPGWEGDERQRLVTRKKKA